MVSGKIDRFSDTSTSAGSNVIVHYDLYDRLLAANWVDLELHEAPSRKIDATAKSPPRVSPKVK